MILAEITTEKGNFHVIAEDESDARDKVKEYLRKRFFTEIVIIESLEILSSTNKFYSDSILIL